MHKDAALEEILIRAPRLIYVSGKTCTGKSTFARQVALHGYTPVELDAIVTRSVVEVFQISAGDAFITAYRDQGPSEHVAAFIAAAHQEISERVRQTPLVIEGAIARTRILREVFSGEVADFYFVYFHPIDIDTYVERILMRFTAGAATGTTHMPKHFWDILPKTDLEAFLATGILGGGIRAAVHTYALRSMAESQERLESFKESFPSICVVEV